MGKKVNLLPKTVSVNIGMYNPDAAPSVVILEPDSMSGVIKDGEPLEMVIDYPVKKAVTVTIKYYCLINDMLSDICRCFRNLEDDFVNHCIDDIYIEELKVDVEKRKLTIVIGS